MESASNHKKRKICHEEEEEEEEAKMEKFFALIRSIRESRERLMNCRSDANEEKKVKNRVGVWKPQFQIEDFMEAGAEDRSQRYPSLNSAVAAGASHKKGGSGEEKEGEKGMDLSLSL